MTRICTRCGVEKPLEDFNKHPNGLHGLQPTCRDCNRERCQKYRLAVIEKVFTAYGGKCVCCGETNPLFLTLDHINGDGAKHRKEIGNNGPRGANSDKTYRWAIKNNYPNTLQILCFNCNCGKQRNGGVLCPHIIITLPEILAGERRTFCNAK